MNKIYNSSTLIIQNNTKVIDLRYNYSIFVSGIWFTNMTLSHIKYFIKNNTVKHKLINLCQQVKQKPLSVYSDNTNKYSTLVKLQ